MNETEILKTLLGVSIIFLQVLMYIGIKFTLEYLSDITEELKKLNRRDEQQSR